MVEYLKQVNWTYAAISLVVSIYLWYHVKSIDNKMVETPEAVYLKSQDELENSNGKSNKRTTTSHVNHGNGERGRYGRSSPR